MILLRIMIILFSGLSFFSFANGQSTIGSKQWEKNWAKVSNVFWMQKTEVTNAEFRTFLDDVKKYGNLDGYYAYYPDSLGWKLLDNANEPLVSYYFSHPSFDNYPVVNISYDAAVAYCQWLTSKYASQQSNPFGKVGFRLPTREEWMLAARSGKDDGRPYPWDGTELRNKKNERLCNYLASQNQINREDLESPIGKTNITAPVNAHLPNTIGLFNVSGNVAEMVSEPSVAVGGSYRDNGNNVSIDSQKKYTHSAPDVGFRVLMVKIAD
jgi:formylglycine-generating enzyme required for sulfatase activity